MRIARLALILALSLPLVALMPGTARSSAAVTYTVTDLGTLPGYTGSIATDINDAGQVVGSARQSETGPSRAFLWIGGTMQELAPLSGYTQSYANGINAGGQVVGGSYTADGPRSRATLWQNEGLVDLGTLPDRIRSDATDINDTGQIVGIAQNLTSSGYRAFLWENGAMVALPALPARPELAYAYGINSAGLIVGISFNGQTSRAVLWQNKIATELEMLPGYQTSSARRINDAGDIIGGVTNSGASGRAVLWRGGAVSALRPADGLPVTVALDLNDSGQVVGWVGATQNAGDDSQRAVIWYGDSVTNLNSLIPASSGWVLTHATGINNSGQIVGVGKYNGEQRAFLLTPSEPPPPPAPKSPPLPIGTAPQCFVETAQCTRSLFADYWAAHGALAINGYPISGEFTEVLEDGKPYTVQYFERVRMEYHPENPAPYNVLLGQFGRRLHPADPPVAQAPGMAYFPDTGHNVPPDFLAYWAANGGLPQFGFPLSEVIVETLEDGKTYEVQYFERARLERHPENPAPYNILLGQFGRRILGDR